ncbi:unnamed protein product [Blepharisma stoltei]|uniref:Phosphorylated adapter RNA export protein n=1 Tax=Blepharisma stoltei TaxID=1481888 RepID=A0AAU9IWN4_9CILI|nr:unnamed protein product [Blepharisma stoltei]
MKIHELFAEDPLLFEKICELLKTKEKELIRSIISIMTGDFAIKLLEQTLEIEDNGGLFKDNWEKRSLRGVFFYLLKQNTTPAQQKLIFNPETQEKKKRYKERKRLIMKLKSLSRQDEAEEGGKPLHSLWDRLSKASEELPTFKLSPGILSINQLIK